MFLKNESEPEFCFCDEFIKMHSTTITCHGWFELCLSRKNDQRCIALKSTRKVKKYCENIKKEKNLQKVVQIDETMYYLPT